MWLFTEFKKAMGNKDPVNIITDQVLAMAMVIGSTGIFELTKSSIIWGCINIVVEFFWYLAEVRKTLYELLVNLQYASE